MKISIVLMLSEKPTADGYPLKIMASHNSKVQRRGFAYAWPEHWSEPAKMITEDHPDFDTLAPIIMSHKLKARKLQLTETDAELAMRKMFAADNSNIRLKDFGDEWLRERRELAASYDKKADTKNRNRADGYADTVENALAQFHLYAPSVSVDTLDKNLLTGFKRDQQLKGNRPATIHLYLRTIRMLYNAACEKHGLKKEKPFEGVFNGLALKGARNKKKWLDIEAVRVLERMELTGGKELARDLWLLQFYFAGADMIDIYFLKKIHLRKGRVRFERGKVAGGQVIDLAVHPKAQAILDKYAGDGEWQFPWRKDVLGYKGFLRRVQKALQAVQQAQNAYADRAKRKDLRIDVLPELGHLAPKVARHTFGNRGKQLMIESDVLRELMGHERDGVDTFYKDAYSEKVRDAALFEVIGE